MAVGVTLTQQLGLRSVRSPQPSAMAALERRWAAHMRRTIGAQLEAGTVARVEWYIDVLRIAAQWAVGDDCKAFILALGRLRRSLPDRVRWLRQPLLWPRRVRPRWVRVRPRWLRPLGPSTLSAPALAPDEEEISGSGP